MDRALIDYIPPIMRNFPEYTTIMNVEQSEFESLESCTERALSNMFINDCDEHACRRYESMLGIMAKDTDTLDDRHFKLLAKFNEQLPYTEETLRENLTLLCGGEGYTLIINEASYTVTVKVALDVLNMFNEVVNLIRRAVPANMVVNVIQMYNTYGDYEGNTYGSLINKTFEQLRNEVII